MNIDSEKGYLFDLDGVLIDSEREYTRIWTEVEKEFPTGVADFATKIKGCTLKNILTDYFKAEDREAVKERLYEKERLMHYTWLPGAEQFLYKLKAAGCRTALYTSSDKMKMRHLEEEIPGICGLFDAVVTGDMVSHSKPDPQGYIMAADMLGLKPEECIVFEDSLQGVKAGRSAGCKVVGVSGTLPEATIARYCDVVVDTLNQLEK